MKFQSSLSAPRSRTSYLVPRTSPRTPLPAPRISIRGGPRLLLLAVLCCLSACNYDEEVEVCTVTVQLIYPEDSVDPYEGVRVELKSNTASIFVDSTDATGTAHFLVTPGIYEASSSSQLTTYDWRYNFNGIRSMNIVSPDSANHIRIELKMSRKRIVH